MRKHFTATAYIVSRIDNQYKLLLHKHKKHGLWVGIGGHIEDNENPIETLFREVKEETNLQIQLLNKNKLIKAKDVEELTPPDLILEEKLVSYKNQPAHFHTDLIYFAFCKKPKSIKMKEEYSWFSKNDLRNIKIGKEVKYLVQKLLSLL